MNGRFPLSPTYQRILVARLSALGDVVMTMPAVKSLRERRPEADIRWLVEDRAASILDAFPSIDGVFVYPRRIFSDALKHFRWRDARNALASCLRPVREFDPDVALDFQSNLKSALLLKLAGVRERVGFDWRTAKELAWVFYTQRVRADSKAHRLDRAAALLREIDAPVAAEPPFLEPPAAIDHMVEIELRRLLGGRPFCAIHPGSSEFGAFKRWPPENYAQLAERLHDRLDLKTLVLWGPSEESLARFIVDRARDAAILSPSWPSAASLAAIAKRARLYVGADTGPTYIFWGAGCPVVALFGPKSETIYAPRGEKINIVTASVDCRPCGKRSCPNPLCMRLIEVENVFQTCQELLRKNP